MSYTSYLREFEERVYSDLTPSTDDIMYANARAMDIYGQGKRFQIEDNLIYYEIVKIIREIVDKHFYQHPVHFYIQVANKEAIFTFIIEKIDAKYSYFVETLYMYVTTQIYRKFGDYFNVIREDEVEDNDSVIMRIIVRKAKKE
ncbi:MAG: hypothetical protein QXG00_08765 [Candidatus Woesearchaeota archaeon]